MINNDVQAVRSPLEQAHFDAIPQRRTLPLVFGERTSRRLLVDADDDWTLQRANWGVFAVCCVLSQIKPSQQYRYFSIFLDRPVHSAAVI